MARLGNPITLTWVLSAAAVLGFGAYQLVAQLGVDPTPDIETPSAPAAEPLSDQLPDFTLAQLGGDEANLHNWLGQPLVINFWATWCAPCLREIPLLVAFQSQQQPPDGVQIIGVAVDRADAVEKFAASMDFNYPNLMGESDAMDAAAAFGAEFFALPFTVFADASGRILAVHTGEIHQGDLDNFAAVIADMNLGQSSVAQARARLAGNL